jgi:tetratricopeptide (TPR) repeat protein
MSFFQEIVNKTIIDLLGSTRKPKTSDGKFEVDENEAGSIIDALMFEGDYQGKSPLAYFINNAPLTQEEREMYQSWLAKTRYSVFEIKEVMFGKNLVAIDLLTKETLVIYEKLATYDTLAGEVITGRIVPFADAWMFTGGTNIKLTPEMLSIFTRLKKSMKIGDIKQLDIIKTFLFHSEPETKKNIAIEGKTNELGLKEKTLIQVMLSESHEIIESKAFDKLTSKEQQEQIDEFTKKWMNTPQEELNGETPDAVIIAEREKLGLPPPMYRHTIKRVETEGYTEQCHPYDKAIDLMREQEYLEALVLFASLLPLNDMDEPFRWYCNVGSCLANIGEEQLAKRYYQKALRLNPKYDVAKKNLVAFDDPGTVQKLHLMGTQWLFHKTLLDDMPLMDRSIEQNECLRDAIAFLTYVEQRKPHLTPVNENIKKGEVLAINRIFLQPDPEMITIPTPKSTMNVSYTEEWQFPKVNFFHEVFFQDKFIKKEKKRLTLTRKGKAFFSLSPDVQLVHLLGSWFFKTNWLAFDVRSGWVPNEEINGNPAIEFYQLSSYSLLTKLTETADKPKEVTKLFAVELVESYLLRHVFLSFLQWAGIIGGLPTVKDSLPNPEAMIAMSQKVPKIQITAFGKTLLQTIAESIHDAIPTELRKFV